MSQVVDFNNVNSVSDLIKLLINIDAAMHEDNNEIELIVRDDYNELQYILYFVVWINSQKNRGRSIKINTSNINRYLQRIDFYKHIGVLAEENFQRHNTEHSMLEIKPVGNSINTDIEIVNSIVGILKKQYANAINVVSCLNYCLWELVDNVKHSGTDINAYIVVQSYPKKSSVEIILIDSGCGIYNSLSQNKSLDISSETDAIRKSVRQGYTKGDGGRGNGLYHTVKFIKANKGNFVLYSGAHSYEVTEGREAVSDMPFWQGTAVFLRIFTDVDIDFDDIFGAGHIPTTVEEFGEEYLW